MASLYVYTIIVLKIITPSPQYFIKVCTKIPDFITSRISIEAKCNNYKPNSSLMN